MEGNNSNRPKPARGAIIAYNVFMICFYLAVGIIFILNIFDIIDQTISICVGSLLCAYALFRIYRLYRELKN